MVADATGIKGISLGDMQEKEGYCMTYTSGEGRREVSRKLREAGFSVVRGPGYVNFKIGKEFLEKNPDQEDL